MPITFLIRCYRAKEYASDYYIYSSRVVDARSGWNHELPDGNYHLLLSPADYKTIPILSELYTGSTYSVAMSLDNSQVGIWCLNAPIEEECIRCHCSPNMLVLPYDEKHFFVCEDCYCRDRLRIKLETHL